MEFLPGSAFSRRPDRNGIIVSTCNACFAAVALSQREAELETAERQHACKPGSLTLWKEFLREIKRNGRSAHRGLNRIKALPHRADVFHAQAAGKPSSGLDGKIRGLSGDISRFQDHSARWHRIHRGRRTGLLLSSAVCTLLATLSGFSTLSDGLDGIAGPLAAVFSALNGAAIAALATFRYSEKAEYYERAVTVCDELTQKLKHHVRTDREFDAVLAELYALRKLEGGHSRPRVKVWQKFMKRLTP